MGAYRVAVYIEMAGMKPMSSYENRPSIRSFDPFMEIRYRRAAEMPALPTLPKTTRVRGKKASIEVVYEYRTIVTRR